MQERQVAGVGLFHEHKVRYVAALFAHHMVGVLTVSSCPIS